MYKKEKVSVILLKVDRFLSQLVEKRRLNILSVILSSIIFSLSQES